MIATFYFCRWSRIASSVVKDSANVDIVYQSFNRQETLLPSRSINDKFMNMSNTIL